MAFLTHQIFLLSGSIPILQGGPLFRGKTNHISPPKYRELGSLQALT
jgi:hypothetical protein